MHLSYGDMEGSVGLEPTPPSLEGPDPSFGEPRVSTGEPRAYM